MFNLESIAERRIREAMERGEFDHLEGRGKPLSLEDDSGVPEDLRLAYKILKNAGCLPPELELKREIRQMEEALADMKDEKERYLQLKRLNWAVTRLNLMRSRSVSLDEKERYEAKLCEKFSTAKRRRSTPAEHADQL
ncbi:MAG: DnaJ family domain-containing protein [Pseudomonadota bacterium]